MSQNVGFTPQYENDCPKTLGFFLTKLSQIGAVFMFETNPAIYLGLACHDSCQLEYYQSSRIKIRQPRKGSCSWLIQLTRKEPL